MFSDRYPSRPYSAIAELLRRRVQLWLVGEWGRLADVEERVDREVSELSVRVERAQMLRRCIEELAEPKKVHRLMLAIEDAYRMHTLARQRKLPAEHFDEASALPEKNLKLRVRRLRQVAEMLRDPKDTGAEAQLLEDPDLAAGLEDVERRYAYLVRQRRALNAWFRPRFRAKEGRGRKPITSLRFLADGVEQAFPSLPVNERDERIAGIYQELIEPTSNPEKLRGRIYEMMKAPRRAARRRSLS